MLLAVCLVPALTPLALLWLPTRHVPLGFAFQKFCVEFWADRWLGWGGSACCVSLPCCPFAFIWGQPLQLVPHLALCAISSVALPLFVAMIMLKQLQFCWSLIPHMCPLFLHKSLSWNIQVTLAPVFKIGAYGVVGRTVVDGGYGASIMIMVTMTASTAAASLLSALLSTSCATARMQQHQRHSVQQHPLHSRRFSLPAS